MSRRRRGEGSIYQRADGMWIAQVYLPDGKPYQRGRKKESDAIAQLKLMLRDLEDGVMPNQATITVKQWLEHWITEIAKERLKPRTHDTYRSTIKCHLIPHLGSKKLEKLTPNDVRVMTKKIAKSHTTRTAQAVFNVLSKALNDAVKDGAVRYNVCDRMDRPEALSREREPLEVAEVKTVLRHIAPSPDIAATARWATSLFTGARQGEVLGLTWDRVDFDNGILDFSWELARLKLLPGPRPTTLLYPRSAFDVPATFDFIPVWRTACLIPPKTEKSRRIVPMIPPLEMALRLHRENSTGEGLVWTRDDGAAVLSRDDTNAWRQLMVDSGVSESLESTPDQHVGRHTVATLLQDAGVDESVRMAIVGHSQVATHRSYAHVRTDVTRAALTQMNALLA